MVHYDFKVGDLVRFYKGTGPIVVTRIENGIDEDFIFGEYLFSPTLISRYSKSLVPYDGDFSQYPMVTRNARLQSSQFKRDAYNRYIKEHPEKFRKGDSMEFEGETLYIKADKGEDNMAQQDQLFQVKGTEEYGKFLTKDSSKRFVLEMKGSGEVKAFKEDELEEVVPYTVRINSQHFIATEGVVKKGDVLLDKSGNYCYVEAVDTKNRETTEELTGFRRILTEEL